MKIYMHINKWKNYFMLNKDISGYVTIEELQMLLNLDMELIEELIVRGLPFYKMSREYLKSDKYNSMNRRVRHKDKLFDYEEVRDWILAHL